MWPKIGSKFFFHTNYFPWDLLPTSVDVGCSKNRKPKVDDKEKKLMFRHRGDTPEPHQVWYHLPQQGRSNHYGRYGHGHTGFLSKKKKYLARYRSRKLVLRSQTLTCMCARELEQPSRFKVQTRNTCSLLNRANGWVLRVLVIISRLVKYPTNLSIFPRCQFGKSKVVSHTFQGSLFGTFWVIFHVCFSV